MSFDSAGEARTWPVYGFLHVAMHGHWKAVLNEQFRKMNDSGLHERTERLFIVLLGPNPRDFHFQSPKFEIVHTSEDFTEYEYPTLAYLHNFAKSHDAYFYYVHTKGVFNHTPYTQDWRRYMEYFVIEKYRKCLESLETHDLCGVNWTEKPWKHFNGNFWWARSDYVRTLRPPTERELIPTPALSFRHKCERWIGTGQPRVCCLKQSGVNHYHHFYKRECYAVEEG